MFCGWFTHRFEGINPIQEHHISHIVTMAADLHILLRVHPPKQMLEGGTSVRREWSVELLNGVTKSMGVTGACFLAEAAASNRILFELAKWVTHAHTHTHTHLMLGGAKTK